MSHRIFTGAFHALEPRFLEEVRSLQHGDPLAPVPVLVGSNILATYLRRQIAASGHAAANLRFLNFLDLARLLSGARPAKPPIPRLGASAILESVLRENTPAAFVAVSGFPGFRDALLDTFRDLRDAGISPESLCLSLRRFLQSVPDRRLYLESIAELYARFRAKVTLFHDVDTDFQAAAERSSAAPGFLGSKQLLVYGIYDVTGQQEDLLDCLAKSLDLTFFIPLPDHEISSFAIPFLERRERSLENCRTPLKALNASGTLLRLNERNFGLADTGNAGEPLTFDGTCRLVSAPGESKAAAEIVREIISAVSEKVIAGFHEAAVVFRRPEEEIPIVAEALRLRGIPCFIAGGSAFSDRPLSRAVTAICDLQATGFSRQAILTSMELIAASLPEEGAADWDVVEWRSLTNNPRFLSGASSWNSATAALPGEISDTIAAAEAHSMQDEDTALPTGSLRRKLIAARALMRGWELLHRAAADWPEALSWLEWGNFLASRLEPLVGRSEDWQAMAATLDELAHLDAVAATAGFERKIPRNALTRALSDLLAGYSRTEGRFQRSGVNLLSVSAARGLRFPLVIIPGLDEGRFPARPRQDPLLLDAERERIDPGGRLPRKLRRAAEEKLLFDMTCRAASRRLVLLTSRLDEASDREQIPSQFFLRFAESLGGSIGPVREITADSVPGFRSVGLENPAPRPGQVAIDEQEIRLRQIAGGMEHNVLAALAESWPELLKKPAEFDRARFEKRLTAYDGRMTDPEVLAWIRSHAGPEAGPVSASRLERYAACPYRFFLDRVVGIEEWREEEPATGLDPLQRGEAIHSILETFLKQRADGLAAAPLLELWPELRTIAARDLQRIRPVGIPDVLWEIECERLSRVLENWLTFELDRADEGFTPTLFECTFGAFGQEQTRPPVKIRTRSGYEFEFRGRIDRVDFAEDRSRARLVDYKSGKLPPSMERKKRTLLMAGEKMQLAIYAAAIRPEVHDLTAITAEYLHLQHRSEEIVPCSYPGDKVSEAFELLPEILEIIGNGISRGIFFDRARGRVWSNGHCEHCPYQPVCGKDREWRQERKSMDPSVVAFLRISELDAIGEGGK